MRPLTPTALAALVLAGCHVYDAALLDASRDASDAARDVPDAGDVPTVRDGGDGGTDAAADADASVIEAGSCDMVLAAGAPCIEPFSGERWSADDPRLLAPGAIVATGDTASATVLVADPGTGRLVSFGADAHAGHRVAGTGAYGVPVSDGDALAAPLSTPAALLPLPGGDVLVAESTAHALYAYRTATARIERYGRLFYQSGPFALAQPAADTLLVAADNQVFAVTLAGDAPTTSTPIVGRSCGAACPGFNPTPTDGTSTQLATPTGVDFDADYVYIADSQNCRIRRAARTGTPAYLTTVFAGSGCAPSADILENATAGSTSVAATSARLGPVGDVRVGADGAVYFTDPTAHCAILAVPTRGASAGQLRVLLGSSQGCGQAGPGGVALGRLGGLALSADRATLYFADAQSQRVGRLALDGSSSPTVTWVADPGPIPSATETASTLRAGGTSGVAVGAPSGASPSVYWSGLAEGRVYQAPATGGAATVFVGTGHQRLLTPLLANLLEPGGVSGLGYADGKLLIGLREHAIVAYADRTSLFPLAGSYDAPGDPMLAPTEALRDLVRPPGWPVIASGTLYFTTHGPGARVFRLPNAMPSTPLEVVAGTSPGADAGAPPTDGGSASATGVALGQPEGLALDADGNVYVADEANSVVWRVRTDNSIEIAAGIYGSRFGYSDADSDARSVAVPTPVALAFDGAHTIDIADVDLLRVRALDVSTGRLVTVAGSGPVAPNGATDTGDWGDSRMATLGRPAALAWSGDRLYIGMQNTGRVRVLRPAH